MQKRQPYRIIKYLIGYFEETIEWIIYHFIGIVVIIKYKFIQLNNSYG